MSSSPKKVSLVEDVACQLYESEEEFQIRKYLIEKAAPQLGLDAAIARSFLWRNIKVGRGSLLQCRIVGRQLFLHNCVCAA